MPFGDIEHFLTSEQMASLYETPDINLSIGQPDQELPEHVDSSVVNFVLNRWHAI